MSPENIVFLSLRLLSGILGLILIYFLWKRRHSEEAFYLLLFELFALVWIFADTVVGFYFTVPQKLFWTTVSYIGVTSTPVFYLMFTLSFARPERAVSGKVLFLLLLIPGITLVLAFTNSFHGLIWKRIDFIPENGRIIFNYGLWFWIFVTYVYLLLTTGLLHLFVGIFRFCTVYRTRILLLIIGSLLPIAANILYVFKLVPLEGVDLTPISFIFSGIFVCMGMFWHRLFDIIPLARKQVIDNLDDGLLVVDMSNRVIDTNPVFNKISGLSKDHVLGSLACNVFQLIGNIDIIPVKDHAKFEIYIEFRDEGKYYEVRKYPILDKSSNQIGITYVLHNITQIKDSMNELTLSNERLLHEMTEKERLILDLDAYARTVAHDLKNPMGIISGYIELMQMNIQKWDLEKILETTGIIKTESNHICNIIEELLLFSRIRVEEIDLVAVDMKDLIEASKERLMRLYQDEIIDFNMPDNWPMLWGNSQWLKEVWGNLISNAIKYGGRPAGIKLGYERIDNEFYRLWIQDNGAGLPRHSLDRLFRDFERLDAKHTNGYGLGLTIVKRIIQKLGGDVFVTSKNKPGEGCIFSFTLKAVN